MARPRVQRTKEELAEMNRERRNRYYQSHKEKESLKNLERYHSKKVLSDGDLPFTSSMLSLNASSSGSLFYGWGIL